MAYCLAARCVERQGFGRQLHNRAVGWLFERGAETIWLTTSAASRAEGFYRATGWYVAGVEHNGEIRFERRDLLATS